MSGESYKIIRISLIFVYFILVFKVFIFSDVGLWIGLTFFYVMIAAFTLDDFVGKKLGKEISCRPLLFISGIFVPLAFYFILFFLYKLFYPINGSIEINNNYDFLILFSFFILCISFTLWGLFISRRLNFTLLEKLEVFFKSNLYALFFTLFFIIPPVSVIGFLLGGGF